MVEASGEDDRVRVTGAEARRVKREVLGVPDRIKHQRRVAVPMQRRAPEAGNRRRAYDTAATPPLPRPSS
ncbi:Transposase OS=Streptomyces microflavus OX=1919 GN=Smic_44250 PE=3 SV=1 [Streptomyces microflavus]